MDHILNTKCNRKHCTLEALIKKEDVAQDMSRAAMFERFTIAAENVEDWSVVATMLGSIKTGSDDPNFTNYQARYSDDTAERLEKIKDTMVRSLKDGGNITKVLQTQFMLQLLMMNYLDIGESGTPMTEAEIKTTTAVIAGTVKGNIDVSEKLILESSSQFVGNIKTKQLIIQEGAIFHGNCQMGLRSAGEKPAPAPKKEINL